MREKRPQVRLKWIRPADFHDGIRIAVEQNNHTHLLAWSYMVCDIAVELPKPLSPYALIRCFQFEDVTDFFFGVFTNDIRSPAAKYVPAG